MQAVQSDNVRLIHRKGDTKRHINQVTDRGEGVVVERKWTTEEQSVWDTFTTEERVALITDAEGNVAFEQPVTDVPPDWSQLAVNVVASKYFRGTMGTPERETSIHGLINRVVSTITGWGVEGGYFKTEDDSLRFFDELEYLVTNQMFAFNSPVWFNVGAPGEEHPQCSACFINEVSDDMESIMALAATEARLFKGGSGAGCNLSTLRSSKEGLSGGGIASGPVSFMKGYDAFAGVIKSGGKTRRAAKMVMLDCVHPDIMEFITCKANEEKKAWALIDAGYGGDFRGEAYSSVFFQNANHSVRVSDAFMAAALNDDDWDLIGVCSGDVMETVKARDVLMEVARATHLCGDPGLQYDTTINKWHTCSATDRIHASNPCSEYMFLNQSACNLGSLNLLKFLDYNDNFDIEAFKHAVDICILAQEIIVDFSSYPTAPIAQNSHDYRPLGLGYANLGALLMTMGLPYDSNEGRNFAGAITSLMCGQAYAMSAIIAQDRGAFNGYEKNRDSMIDVMHNHRAASYSAPRRGDHKHVQDAANEAWDIAVGIGEKHGYRNAQVTVLAPTGTIAFMMDCDTTGIEPDIALVKFKKLVGGGQLKIVNQAVPRALRKLGYDKMEVSDIVSYVDEHGTIEGSRLRDEHLGVFDCALRAAEGTRSIAPMGHVKMMGAAQPFLSGAISKTVNVPEDASEEDIYDMYMEGWKLGLKAIAIYRDGSKRSQPLDTTKTEKESTETVIQRKKLPADRDAKVHKFNVGGHEGFLTMGFYPDGTLGEIFISMSKQGSTVCGLMDTIAIQTSMALQYGIPLDVLVKRFSHLRFEPSGFTGNKDVPMAKSLVDYIFRFLGSKYLDSGTPAVGGQAEVKVESYGQTKAEGHKDSPACPECGAITQRSGSCYTCGSCGATTGCG